ncbi:MAG: hypothetical protein WBJ33_07265 [Candidatus Nanopelagicales bacterium]
MHDPSRFKRLKVLLMVPLVVLAGSVAMAGPSQAASNPALVHFDTDFSPSLSCSSSASTVRANPGDSITLTWSNAQGSTNGTWFFNGPSGQIPVAMSTSRASSVSFSTVGTYSLDSSLSFRCSLTVSIVSEPVDPPEAHDYLQQVGIPLSGDCSDVPNYVGHLPGFPIGGWSKSWALWPNDGLGGPVCTREVEERPDGTIVLVG